MTDWYTDDRQTKHYGDHTVVSQQNRQTGDTAHLVILWDGTSIRVVPDGTSGQRRARAVKTVLENAASLRDVSGDLMTDVVLGGFARHGLKWELLVPDSTVTVEEWLDSWFELFGVEDVAYARKSLLGDLADDGWAIRRAE